MNFRRTSFVVDFCNSEYFTKSTAILNPISTETNIIHNSLKKLYVESVLEYSRFAFDCFPKTSELSVYLTGSPPIRVNNYSRNEQNLITLTNGFYSSPTLKDRLKFKTSVLNTIKDAVTSLSEETRDGNVFTVSKKQNIFRCIILCNRSSEFNSIDHEWLVNCVHQINKQVLKLKIKGQILGKESNKKKQKEKEKGMEIEQEKQNKKKIENEKGSQQILKQVEFIIIWTDLSIPALSNSNNKLSNKKNNHNNLIGDNIYQKNNSIRITEYSYHPTDLFKVIQDLAMFHFRLSCYQIYNIPMRNIAKNGNENENENQNQKAKHNVELLIPDFDRSVKKKKTKDKVFIPGVTNILGNNNKKFYWKKGYLYSNLIGIATKKTIRATPTNVSSFKTICLIRYLKNGKIVILENKKKTKKIMLSMKNDWLFLSKIYKSNFKFSKKRARISTNIEFPTLPNPNIPENSFLDSTKEQWDTIETTKYLTLFSQIKRIIDSNIIKNQSNLQNLKFVSINVEKNPKIQIMPKETSKRPNNKENNTNNFFSKNQNYKRNNANNISVENDSINTSNGANSGNKKKQSSLTLSSFLNNNEFSFINDSLTTIGIKRKTCHVDLDFNKFTEIRNLLLEPALQIKLTMEDLNPPRIEIESAISSLKTLYEQKQNLNYQTIWKEMFKFFQLMGNNSKHLEIVKTFYNLYNQTTNDYLNQNLIQILPINKIPLLQQQQNNSNLPNNIHSNENNSNKIFFQQKQQKVIQSPMELENIGKHPISNHQTFNNSYTKKQKINLHNYENEYEKDHFFNIKKRRRLNLLTLSQQVNLK
ncbi:sarcoma antigen ny-sar-95-related [Anaeramoeba flamelloides]|uniref:Sarcoma antigen ny-sar-95-related n=1 Tax=Anaeramoeba flamelloides TaxID=1746091 RepID=A0ABQ8XLN0_9EUKA|nr:sarcoma antigen ny-sar-95-related [Anaeramoeba flamelloides]